MKMPGARRWIVAAGALLAALAPAAPARACGGEAVSLLVVGAVGLLAPSEFGASRPAADGSTTRVVLGWSWQIPVGTKSLFDYPSRHRIVPSVDLLPHPGGASWRGRLGYRYGRRHLLAGAGVGVDGAGVNLSPELGVKFLHGGRASEGDWDPSLHLLGRAAIDPESGHLRGGTILLGWNFL